MVLKFRRRGNADPALIAYPIVAKEAEIEVVNNEFGLFWASGEKTSKKSAACLKPKRRLQLGNVAEDFALKLT